MKRVITIAAIASIAAIIYILWPKPPVVHVVAVFRGDLSADLSTTGIVESELSDVTPKIMSPVRKLLVQENETVRAGQPLALLDGADLLANVNEARATLSAARSDLSRAEQAVQAQSKQSAASISRARALLRGAEAQLADLQEGARPQEIAQARNAVHEAEAQEEQAKADLKRAETLQARGAIPAQQLDAARTTADIATARLQAAREQLDLLKSGPRPDAVKAAQAQVGAAEAGLAEALASTDLVKISKKEAAIALSQVHRAQAALHAAEAQLGYAVVRSPFAGVVARKHLEEGEVAGPGSPVFTLARLKHVWVTAEVDEEDIAALALGQKLKITTDAYPGTESYGKVVRISRIAEPKAVGRVRAKIVRAKIDILSSGFQMKPGMEVDITGSLPVGRNLVLVSNDALVQVGDRYRVFVARQRRVYPRFVTVGASNFDFTEVVKGLEPGDLAATSMLDKLKSGQRIRERRHAGDAD